MTKTKQLLLLLFSLLLLTACDGGVYSGTLIFEGDHRYDAETRLPGDIFLRAGTAEFAKTAEVDGSIYMLGGTLLLNGTVAQHLVVVDGTVTLGPEAVIGGDLRVAGGTVTQAETAVVRGNTMRGSLPVPDEMLNRSQEWDDVLRLLVSALLLAGWAALLVQRRPQPILTVGEAVVDNPLPTGAMGLLVLLVLPALLVVMAFTIVLLPLVAVVGLLLLLLLGYGYVAIGTQIGLLLGQVSNRPIPLPALAFGGTLLLAGLMMLPFIGGGIALATTVFIAGSLPLTWFGIRPFTPAWPAASADLSEYGRTQP